MSIKSLILDLIFPNREFEKRRKRFLRGRRGVYISDEAFVTAAFGSPSHGEKKIAVILRRIIAFEYRLAPEKVCSDEGLTDLALIPSYDPYWDERWIALEEELQALTGMPIRVRLEKLPLLQSFPWFNFSNAPDGSTFGAWARDATREVLEELAQSGWPV